MSLICNLSSLSDLLGFFWINSLFSRVIYLLTLRQWRGVGDVCKVFETLNYYAQRQGCLSFLYLILEFGISKNYLL